MIENRLKLALAVLVLSAACHRGSTTMQREQKNYQVVPEGQASGVSSTINAPGEVPPPMTNTSADTTSNFTLAPNVDTTGTAPGTIAGTLPPPAPANPAPVRTMTPAQPQQSRVVITNTNPQPPPPPRTTKRPPSDEPAPPSQTDTTSTTTEQTDTTATDDQAPPPPPPPTQTDTRGW